MQKPSLFQDLNTPTESDLEFVKIVWQHLTPEQRLQFENSIREIFSEWDITAFKELSKTVIFIRSA